MPMLRTGQVLNCINTGQQCVVENLLGEGGQGEVWRVQAGSHAHALKWFNPVMIERDPDLRTRIERLVEIGAPSRRFLWPFEIVEDPQDARRFGYLQRLRGESFVELKVLIASDAQLSFRVLAEMCYLLCDELFALHSKGLCYADLNAGNVFANRATGDIEIFDNDNVDIDGKPSIMMGFPGFQAPEVVMRRALATRTTDLHSLAVMLFRVFLVGHPLDGSAVARLMQDPQWVRLDPARRRAEMNERLYGDGARFVFDPDDDSNRPLPAQQAQVIAYWDIYPQFFRDIFTRAFTVGLRDPEYGRVTLSEWRKSMARLHDAVMTCPDPACEAENFYDTRRGSTDIVCWACRARFGTRALRLELRTRGARPGAAPQHTIVLENKARLFAHHTAGGRYDFSRVTGEVTAAPVTLRNCSNRTWAVSVDGVHGECAPGSHLRLRAGMKLFFGDAEGHVIE